MTADCWTQQKARFIDRFGKNNFSPEFSLLVSIECRSMPDEPFVHMVNALIGNRKPSNPPLMQDFRDARLAFEKRKFESEVRGASGMWNGSARFVGLKVYLATNFPGCTSLSEATEIRKLQIMAEKTRNPAYHPMEDRTWMGGHAWENGKGPAK